MSTFELPLSTERFVLHFETDRHEISAYGLAAALTGLSSALRTTNSIVNPGYYVEIVVETLEDGSFKAFIKTIFRNAKTLLAHEAPRAILYSVIAAYIYEHTLSGSSRPIIIVNDQSVIIESGDTRVVVPREVHEAQKHAAQSKQFRSAIGQLFNGATLDPFVSALTIQPNGAPNAPPIPRNDFVTFTDPLPPDELNSDIDVAYLEISRAILSRGRRKWEFYWHGMKIAAPVLDQRFYDQFFAHEITIAPGDVLQVLLRIYRTLDADTGILMNSRYEVIEVLKHIPTPRQSSF